MNTRSACLPWDFVRNRLPRQAAWLALGAGLGGGLWYGNRGAANAAEVLSFSGPSSFAVHERAGAVRLSVRRAGALGGPATVEFRTIEGTALEGREYVGSRGTLSFGPEDRTRSFDVPLLSGRGGPASTAFRVVLERPSANALLQWPTDAHLTVLDDDAVTSPTIEFAAGPGPAEIDVREAEGTVAIAVVRSGSVASPASVRYEVVRGTATPAQDFESSTGEVHFAVGESLKTLLVTVINDRVPEPDETCRVRLLAADGGVALGSNTTTTIWIRDDDTAEALDAAFRPGLGLDDRVRAMIRQPDGRLIVAGDFNFAGGVRRDEIARFLPDGSLDVSFDAGPVLRGRLGLGALALALQDDGKVLVGGDFTNTNDLRQPILARLNPDGSLDPSFVPASSSSFRVRAIAVQPDRRILVGGLMYEPGGLPNNVVRLNSDGSLDPDFEVTVPRPGGGGSVPASLNGEVLALALQPDGRVLLAGNFYDLGTISRPHVARLNRDGSLDLTFTPGTGANSDISALALQPDGRIIVAGEFSTFNGQSLWKIARLNEDGSLDPSFAPRPGASREIHAVALQPNGQIVIGGEFTQVNDVPRGYVARLNGDGSLDPTFNPVPGADDEVRALALAPDGVFVGGDFTMVQGINLNRLARLHLGPPPAESVSFMLGRCGAFEHAGAVSLTVRRHGQGTEPLTVGYRTLPGTATTNEYIPQTGTLTFRGMETEMQISIPLLDDPVAEDAKTFLVQIEAPSSGLIGTHGQAEVTILDSEIPAVLDPTFNPEIAQPVVCALTSDVQGRLLLGGLFGLSQPMFQVRLLARLNVDGSLDTNFVPGIVGTRVRTLLALANGSVVVGGALAPNRVRRLAATGADDAAFSSPVFDDEVRVVAASADGALLVGGDFTHADGVSRKRIARLTATGALDASFDPGGGANDQVLAIQEQPDGRVLLGGRFTKIDGTRRTYLARLLGDGRLDPSFNPALNDRVRAVVPLVDGRLLVGGRFTSAGGVQRWYLARLAADGSVDASFVPAEIDNEVRSLTVMPDGRIVVAGEFSTVGGVSRNCVARLNADGSLDALFQPGTGADGTVWAALVNADGAIVIGGEFWSVAGVARPAVARLNGEQPPGLEIISALPGLGCRLRVHGVAPNSYAVAASVDLTTWQTLGTRTAAGATLEWVDADAAGFDHRYYRAWRVRP